MNYLERLSSFTDQLTATDGSLGYIVILVLAVGGYMYTSSTFASPADERVVISSSSSNTNDKEATDPPRNFTSQQLRQFDGRDDKPVYLSVSGIVFDVSDGRGFYGPGGPYEKFAGRECGIALSKMSFDDEHLDDLDGLDQLNFGEKTELEGWIDKFTNYRCYPVRGRLIPDRKLPDPIRRMTRDEIAQCDGTQNIPDGYAAAPIYIGAGDKVFDMSFGGVTFYGAGGPYQKFAGKDASRALAKMSLDEADLQSHDLSDMTEKQLTTMNDWIKTFEEKKSYPLVGRLGKK